MHTTESFYRVVEKADIAAVTDDIAEGLDLHTRVDGEGFVFAAVESGRIAILELLVRAGLQVDDPCLDEQEGNELYWASALNQSEVVRALLRLGASVSAEDRANESTSWYAAAGRGNLAIVEILQSCKTYEYRLSGNWSR